MADLIPVNFPIPPESIIASYDFSDILSGRSYIVFYGSNAKDSTGNNYVLKSYVTATDNNASQDNGVTTWSGTSGVAFVKELDLDFDGVVTKHFTLEGQAIVDMSVAMTGSVSGGNMYWIIKVRHYDGSTETDLGSVQSETNSKTGGSDAWRKNLEIDVSNQRFDIGDTLRITVEGWSQDQGAGDIQIAHDPENNALATIMGANIDSTFKVALPFLVWA